MTFTAARLPYVCGAHPGKNWHAFRTQILDERHSKYMQNRQLFVFHGFPAQVPNVCNHVGVTDASIVSGHPDTASSLYYVAWNIVCFVSVVSVCFVKETLRQGLDRSWSWTNPPEDRTSWTYPSEMGPSRTDPCEMGLSKTDRFH